MRPTPLRRVFRLALALALATAVGGCDRQSDRELTVGVIGDQPKLVQPNAGVLAAADALLIQNVGQGLVRFDARGQIVPGLAQRWNVSDDGLSYIFRLTSGTWPNGRKITAQQVARILKRQIASTSSNPLKETLGAVEDVVAMTDRVLEVRLQSPRPNMLQLLAQPELGILYEGQGSGPFEIAEQGNGGLVLRRSVSDPETDDEVTEQLRLIGGDAPVLVRRFVDGAVDLVLGGSFADLPYARAARLPRTALQFDPVSGLFGLVPARDSGLASDVQVRRLLSQAIDRDALVAALNVPGLAGRATLLEPALDGIPDPVAPDWTATPLGDRRPDLIAAANRMFGADEPRVIRIALPEGPGADLLLRRLAADWGFLGIQVERAGPGKPADFRLVDAVAPSTSPAWFVRQFRCDVRPVCSEEADELVDAARVAPVPPQRAALIDEAARLMQDMQLFIPLAAPVRWSLVSRRTQGFAGNRFARHTLTAIEQPLPREGAE